MQVQIEKIIKRVLIVSLICILLYFATSHAAIDTCGHNIKILQKPIIFNAQRIALTKEYQRVHYGIQSNTITIVPKMIVLHWTALSSLEKSFKTFNHSTLGDDRHEIDSRGALNVSAHFLVDRDGTIYQLMPTQWMARHIIGLNSIAIGIENVGGVNDKDDLTQAQIEANTDLVCFLKRQYPTIQYLIGHFEYKQFKGTSLWQEKNKFYFTKKQDPGLRFMKAVRQRVSDLGLLDKMSE